MRISKICKNTNWKTINKDIVLENWLVEDSNIVTDLRKLWREFASINITANIRVFLANKSSGSIKADEFLTHQNKYKFFNMGLAA
jgi:hypothetical protein